MCLYCVTSIIGWGAVIELGIFFCLDFKLYLTVDSLWFSLCFLLFFFVFTFNTLLFAEDQGVGTHYTDFKIFALTPCAIQN